METEIRRINFFDGLFLKEGEFFTEQVYHQHMRRRLHHILFDGSGVVQANPGDLRIVPTAPPAVKTFHVSAGMAISNRDDVREGREVILRDDSPVIDMGAQGIVASGTAFVTIHYAEAMIDPQVGATPATERRVEEQAVVAVHSSWPPLPLASGEPYILLGEIDFDTMTLDETTRQTALLRSGLVGAVVGPTIPTISTIIPNSGAPGDVPAVQITGTNLANVTAVNVSGANITTSAVVATPTTVDFTMTIGAGASTGLRTVSLVSTDGPASTSFTVSTSVAAPVLLTGIPNTAGTQLDPPLVTPAAPNFEIFGANLRVDFPALPKVELVDAGNSVSVIHTFTVNDVRLENELGFGDYNVIEAQVTTFPVGLLVGRVRITTSGGPVPSTEFLSILP